MCSVSFGVDAAESNMLSKLSILKTTKGRRNLLEYYEMEFLYILIHFKVN